MSRYCATIVVLTFLIWVNLFIVDAAVSEVCNADICGCIRSTTMLLNLDEQANMLNCLVPIKNSWIVSFMETPPFGGFNFNNLTDNNYVLYLKSADDRVTECYYTLHADPETNVISLQNIERNSKVEGNKSVSFDQCVDFHTLSAHKCSYATQRTQCGDLACDPYRDICFNCKTDSDCYPKAMYCKTSASSGAICHVKSFFTFSSGGDVFLTILAVIGALLICAVGVVAGVGGGGMLVPMFCIFLSIPMQSAVGLSQSTICGQSTLNMYFAVQQTFPNANNWKRPLINYQYLSLMLPLGLIGTLIGGQLSKVCPDMVRLLLLFVLLATVLYRTVKKMMQQYKEDKENNNNGAQEVTIENESEELNDANAKNKTETEKSNDDSTNEPAEEAVADEDVKDDQEQYPQYELGMNFLCFFFLLIFNIIRQYTNCGGFWYWMCLLIPLVFLASAFYYTRQRLQKLHDEKGPRALAFAWNQNNNFTYPMVAVIAGAAAAMLGIGGGLVLGFVLYEVGLTPSEASVTGGMATFFIAFASALQLLVGQKLLIDYGIVFFICGLGSTVVGTFYFKEKIKQNNWNFLIVGALAFIVGGSLVVLGGYGIYNAVVSVQLGGSLFSFGSICVK